MTGKQGKSLTLTVGASESREKDGLIGDLAVSLKTARDEPELHLSRGIVVEAKNEKIGVAAQGVEDSTPEIQE